MWSQIVWRGAQAWHIESLTETHCRGTGGQHWKVYTCISFVFVAVFVFVHSKAKHKGVHNKHDRLNICMQHVARLATGCICVCMLYLCLHLYFYLAELYHVCDRLSLWLRHIAARGHLPIVTCLHPRTLLQTHPNSSKNLHSNSFKHTQESSYNPIREHSFKIIQEPSFKLIQESSYKSTQQPLFNPICPSPVLVSCLAKVG